MRRSLMLFMLGCAVMLAGVLQLATGDSPLLSTFAPAPTPGTIAYVSADGCLTCHADRPSDWSEVTGRRLISSPIADPHAVTAASGDVQHTRRIQLSTEASAYPLTGGRPAQQYVLHTEDGTLALPGHWMVDNRVIFSPDPTAPQMNDCAGCHDSSTSGSLSIEPQYLRGPALRPLMLSLALAVNRMLPTS